MEDQPHFRFYPAAYDVEWGRFEGSVQACEVCAKPCGWRYTGNIYAVKPPDHVCARCVHSGELDRYFAARGSDLASSYTLHDAELEADPVLARELLQRTPGVAGYNPFEWPSQNGEPLAFIGIGSQAALYRQPDILAAMTAAWQRIWPDQTCAAPNDYVMIFQTLDGRAYQAVVDLD